MATIDRFGEASLAQTKQHLEAAEERLLLARDTLRAELRGAPVAS